MPGSFLFICTWCCVHTYMIKAVCVSARILSYQQKKIIHMTRLTRLLAWLAFSGTSAYHTRHRPINTLDNSTDWNAVSQSRSVYEVNHIQAPRPDSERSSCDFYKQHKHSIASMQSLNYNTIVYTFGHATRSPYGKLHR